MADTGQAGETTPMDTAMEQQEAVHNMDAISLTDPSVATGEIEALLKRIDYDPYNEDETELRFLHSKPTCFIVLGKPGVGKTTLCKRLAMEWKCELINSTVLLQQHLDMQTEFGIKAMEILIKGEAVPEDMMIKMIEEKISSPEVAHHGYVLDDFPTISEATITVKDQVELIKNWKLKPDFIINIKIPDTDLIKRRVGMKVDPQTGELYTEDIYNPDRPVKDEKDEMEEEEEEEEIEEEETGEEEDMSQELPTEVLERIITRPEDLPDTVEKHITKYKTNMLRLLEEYMADHDQQYLIEMDGNQIAANLFKQLQSKLNCFVLRTAAVPIRLSDPEDDEIPEEIETDELMRGLAPKQMVAPRFRWRRSRWLRNCPVALHEGNIVPGKPDLAVSFLDKTYCMSTAEALDKFMKNPRPYMLPPQPRPPCKISVLGAPYSGKTTFCHLLAQKYGAKVLDMAELIKPRMELEKERTLETTKKEATENAITLVKARIKEKLEAEQQAKEAAEAAERERQEQEDQEREAARLDEADADTEEGDNSGDLEKSTEDPSTAKESDESKGEEVEEAKKEDDAMQTSDTQGEADESIDNTPSDNTTSDVTHQSDNTDTSSSLIGPEQTEQVEAPKEEEGEVVDDNHPEVKEIVDKALEEAKKNPVVLAPEIYFEVMEESIREAEKVMRDFKPDGPMHGGWILDNFPNTRDQWNLCCERNFLPDDVIVLRDHGPESKFLMKRYYYMFKTLIDDKIAIRLEEEEARLKKMEEERRLREEEERKALEEEKKRIKEEERKKREEEGLEPEESEGEGKADEADESKDEEGDEPDSKEESVKQGKSTQETDNVDTKGNADEVVDTSLDSKVSSEFTVGISINLAHGMSEYQEVGDAETDVAESQEEEALPEEIEIERTRTMSVTVDVMGKDEESDSKTEGGTSEATEESNRVEFKEEEKIPDGPEMEEYKEARKVFERDFPNVLATISGGSALEPMQLDIEDDKIEDMLEHVQTSIERSYKYQGWEYAGVDVDEEDEDNEAEAAQQQEEEEEAEAEAEEEDPNRSKKKALGDTNHYCPVALKETNVLYPGNPETGAKYREKIYYFSTPEAREKFLATPEDFLPKSSPPKAPPVRILLLGAKGGGKTLHGRAIAKKLGLFHISFKDRLQELIMHKTKKKIGPEYEEDNQPEPPEDDEDDEETEGQTVAITDPEGNPVKANPADTSKTSDQSGEVKEEEEIEFTEQEEAIKNNLETEDALSEDVLNTIVPNWWHKEPFKSTGFILEGFPRTQEECRYLADVGLFPDAGVILSVEDQDVIARLLPPRSDKWRAKRDKRLERKAKKKEKAQKKKEVAVQKRRDELQKERDEKRKENAALKAEERANRDEDEEEEEEEEEEEDEEDDIEAILAEEFEEEEDEEDEDEELEEDALDRMRNEINDVYDNDTNKLASVMETMDELLIPKVEIDSGRKPHIVRYILNKKLRSIVDARQSIFERVYPINEKLAMKMVATGYKQPSRFGRWCPVRVKEGDCIQTMSGPGYTTYPCIYRSHVYFLSSYHAREEFVSDPIKYVSQPTPKPVVPIKIAVIGPPKSGKTTLANRFAQEYGLLRLSIGEAMRMVLASQPKSCLAKEMQNHLTKGLTVPDELAVQCLDICLLDMRCQTRGYVLDGYPMTKRQLELLTERCIIPVRIFELEIAKTDIMVRGTIDRIAITSGLRRWANFMSQPLHDSSQILAVKNSAFLENVSYIRSWYTEEHMSYQLVNGSRSKWWVWNQTLEMSRDSVRQIQTYLERISMGKAASINDMCVTPNEFMQRVGDFDQYCPVSLALRGELVDCSTDETLTFAVEFRGHYYKCGGKKEMEQFLSEPEKYVPPLAPHKLPPAAQLPKRRRQLDDGETVELQGYCPVTYLDGSCRYEAIKPGNKKYIAQYMAKFWICETEEKLLKFMKLPEQYSSLVLPSKLPPPKDNLSVIGLPMLGYMEQNVATAIIKAMTTCGNIKPKYPFLSASRSALFYIAYHLKAFNPKSSDYVRKKYKKKLERFVETCELIRYLGNTMTVRYKEPNERPIDFDIKLQTFFALRGIEPTPTWIS